MADKYIPTEQQLIDRLESLQRESTAAHDPALPHVRAALDGLAFAAYQAGEVGASTLGDSADVTDWIDYVMREATAARDAAVTAEHNRMNAVLAKQGAAHHKEVQEQVAAAHDAALNLWPRDCRLCDHFSTKVGGCTSILQCVDSDCFKATTPRQYWIARKPE
jgi:hypothetical protein